MSLELCQQEMLEIDWPGGNSISITKLTPPTSMGGVSFSYYLVGIIAPLEADSTNFL